MIKKIAWVTFILLGCFQIAALAAVTVNQHTGTLKITQADGTVVTVGPADALPVIQDGATIEVVDGVLLVSTTDASTAKVVANGQTFQLAAGTTISQTYDSTGAALFEVTAGQASLITTDGWTAALGPCAQISTSGPVTSTTGMNVVKGEVFFTKTGEKTTTMAGIPCAEGYQPPAIPDTTPLDTSVQNEENSRDISPIS